MGSSYSIYFHPEVTPQPSKEIAFDPLYGFENRPVREVKVTQAELESAKIPLADRDYCVDKLLDYRACRADVWPMAYKCAHERHAYFTCQYEDYVMRMKEYERERRLMVLAEKEKAIA